jgi:hypothetical protein
MRTAFDLTGRPFDVLICPICRATYIPEGGQIWLCAVPGCMTMLDTSRLPDEDLWLNTYERIILRCTNGHKTEISGYCSHTPTIIGLASVAYPRTNF